MLDLQFIGLNVYFAVHLLAALVCFAMFWLTYDAYTIRRARPELIKWLGFLLLAIGFMVQAATLQLAGSSSLPLESTAHILRLLGFFGIIVAEVFEPLQPRPKYDQNDALNAAPPAPSLDEAIPDVKVRPRVVKKHHAVLPLIITGIGLPVLAVVAAALYLRRATVGLERHLAPVAWGLGGLAVYEALGQTRLLQDSTNPTVYRLVATFGPVWWLTLMVLMTASIVLGRWVWHYLTKRLQSQLFMILVCQTLVLFMVSTVGFTALLLQNIRTQSSDDLATASNVLGYAVSGRQAETVAQAEAVAATSAVATAIASRDHPALVAKLNGYLAAHSLASLTVTDGAGQVLLRGEDPDRWGDSLSSSPLVRRALIGQTSSSIVATAGAGSPTVTIVAASPVRDGAGLIVGAAVTGRALSGTFVDGVRASTGLDSTVYAGNIRAATTLTRPGSSERAVGVKEPSSIVNTQVLGKNRSYSGTVNIQNRSYLAAFTPLRDINNTPVGMLMAARPADALYTTANRSVQLTFLLMVSLTFLAIYPVFLIARFLSRQVR